jgi:hypothetical protein
LVDRCVLQLQELAKDTVVADPLFIRNAKESHPKAYARYKGWKDSAVYAPVGQAPAGKPTRGLLKAVHKEVKTKKAGVCTHFAYAAADILLAQDHGVRVEVVDAGVNRNITHLFVVVGRGQGSVLQEPHTWGKDAYVIDAWQAALDNPENPNPVWKSPKLPPSAKPVSNVFDSVSGPGPP